MIYKKCVMTIDKNKATLDEDIYLYRLDKNIELYFTIVNNKYRFNKSDMNNIILITNASFFQVRLYKNAEIKYTFAIQPTDGGQAILTITDDLIDDPIEVGDYDFQISLLDEEKTSMISMPIVSKQLHVCEPLVSDDATMGKAILGLSKLATGEIKNAFDSEGNYIREIHQDGDILSASIINKFEEALDTNTKAIKNGTGTSYDDTEIKTDINTIKTDLGTEELTTTAKTVKGAVNEVAAQYKDIAYKTVIENNKLYLVKSDGTKLDGGTDLSKYVTKDELTQGGTVTFRNVLDNEIFTLGTSSSGGDTPITPTNYTITNNLTNCTNSNNATTIEKNTRYQANITTDNKYILDNVIVVMGGNDVTSSAYNNGIINIDSVTGNLIITASATKVSTIDIPEANLLAYYDMSKDLVDGKIQDLSNTGQNLTLESSAKLENGYLMNSGTGGASANYNINPVITATTVDVSSGYTVFAVVSDAKQSVASPIFSTSINMKNSQCCAFQNGLIHYSQDGFNNSASATQLTSGKCIVALSWLPSGNDTIYINGIQKYQSTTKVTKIANTLYLLNGYGTVTSLKLHKIAFYKGELSSSDIVTISNTLLGGNV